MFPFEANISIIDIILYIQAIVWFISAGFLVYLIRKNKLTYIDEFRQKFILAVYVLLLIGAINVIFNIFIKIPQQFSLLLYLIMFLSDVFFIALTLIGTSKLMEYVSSIIDLETKNKKKIAFIISIIVTIFVSIIHIIVKISSSATLVAEDYILFSIAILFFSFAAIYFLFLDQELKKIDINILRYFGISVLFLLSISFSSIFIDVESGIFYWVIVFFGLIGLNFSLILGYLEFKNKIRKGLAK